MSISDLGLLESRDGAQHTRARCCTVLRFATGQTLDAVQQFLLLRVLWQDRSTDVVTDCIAEARQRQRRWNTTEPTLAAVTDIIILDDFIIDCRPQTGALTLGATKAPV